MTPKDVFDYYGSGYKFAKSTGISHTSLANWFKWGYVPENAQYKIERLTNGGLAVSEVIKDKTKKDSDELLLGDIANIDEQIKKLHSKKSILESRRKKGE